MNRSDELTIVRRVFATAVLLSAVHYYDNTVRFEDYTGGKASDGLISRPPTTSGRSPVGSASR
jgi:hypothetical protein